MSESTIQVPPVVEPWSRHAPDGLLVDRLCFEPGRSAPELLERAGAWENVRALVDAQQVRELAGLVAAEQADDALCCPLAELVRSVATQFALTAGLTHGAALARVEEAMTLVHRLPLVLAALGEARLSYRSARVIIEEFTGLGEEQLDEAQRQILERVAGRNHAQIRGCAKRVVARLDADAVRKRAERALEGRYVRLEPAADGMATLWAHLPAAQAVTVYGLVSDYARRAGGGPDDDRSMDARRADAFYDLIVNPELDTCHPDPDVAAGERRRAQARERVRTEIRVTVPLSVLVGSRDLAWGVVRVWAGRRRGRSGVGGGSDECVAAAGHRPRDRGVAGLRHYSLSAAAGVGRVCERPCPDLFDPWMPPPGRRLRRRPSPAVRPGQRERADQCPQHRAVVPISPCDSNAIERV